MKVLLVGNNDRSALAACRALGEKEIEVGIAPIGEWGVAHKSRYCLACHEVGDPTVDARPVAEALKQVVRDHGYVVVVPLSDAACLLCLQIRELLAAKVALPDSETFSFAHDKGKLLQRCKELGIPVPEEGDIESSPVYLKPIHSAIFHDNRILSFQVRRANSRREASDFLRQHSGVVDVLVQEEAPGKGSGVYVLTPPAACGP